MLAKDLFAPRSVAVVGASSSPTKIGNVLLKNILDSGYQGKVYPVNPTETEVLSLPCYPSVGAIPGGVDMAVIAVASKNVIAVLEDCGKKGVKGAVVISAGFKETGEQGRRLEKELLRIVHQYGIRVLGPNCLGMINNTVPINASFAAGVFPKGNITLVAQSGAMRQFYWDWSKESGIGLNQFYSLGNEADITESDVLELLQNDKGTKVVMAYLEGILDGERFRKVASSLTPAKPLVVMKVGNSAGGSKAAVSHTGSMAGSNEVHDAILKQVGAIRAITMEQFSDFAFGLSCQPLLKGDGLAVVTNAGGIGVIASDAIQRAGLELVGLSEHTSSALRGLIPSFASASNPVDLTGVVTPEEYEDVLRIVLADPGVNGILVILCPQGAVEVRKIAGSVAKAASGCGKPVFAHFMGARDFEADLAPFRENNIPNYRSPERAVDGFRAMKQYRLWLERKHEAPPIIKGDRDYLRAAIREAKEQGQKVIAGTEAMQTLAGYGIEIAKASLAESADDAARVAGEIGYPVVMKIVSPDIVHKTESGGVRVGLKSGDEVRDAFREMVGRIKSHNPEARITGVMIQAMAKGQEFILGIKRDRQFGAAVMFGLGGIFTEVLKDVSLRVTPITREDALDMMREIRGYKLLTGARGKKADIETIADYLLRLSQMAIDFPEIAEVDINPLVADDTGKGAVAVDCRIVIS